MNVAFILMAKFFSAYIRWRGTRMPSEQCSVALDGSGTPGERQTGSLAGEKHLISPASDNLIRQCLECMWMSSGLQFSSRPGEDYQNFPTDSSSGALPPRVSGRRHFLGWPALRPSPSRGRNMINDAIWIRREKERAAPPSKQSEK